MILHSFDIHWHVKAFLVQPISAQVNAHPIVVRVHPAHKTKHVNGRFHHSTL